MRKNSTLAIVCIALTVLGIVVVAATKFGLYAVKVSPSRILELSGIPENVWESDRIRLFSNIAAGDYDKALKYLRTHKQRDFYYSWLAVHMCFLSNNSIASEEIACMSSCRTNDNASFVADLERFYRCAFMMRRMNDKKASSILSESVKNSESILLACLWLLTNPNRHEFEQHKMKTLTGPRGMVNYKVTPDSAVPMNLLMLCASTSYENVKGTSYGFGLDTPFTVVFPDSMRVGDAVFDKGKLIALVSEFQQKKSVDWIALGSLSRMTVPDMQYVSVLDKSLYSYYHSVWKGELDQEFPYALQAILLEYFERVVPDGKNGVRIPLYPTMMRMLQVNSFFLLTCDSNRARELLRCAYRVNPGLIEPMQRPDNADPGNYYYQPLYWDLLRLLIERKCGQP